MKKSSRLPAKGNPKTTAEIHYFSDSLIAASYGQWSATLFLLLLFMSGDFNESMGTNGS